MRNQAGRLPLEIPHNSILSDKKMKQAVKESVPNEVIARHDAIQMKKEPDFMFVVNHTRRDVLLDQLDAINENYTENTILDPKDPDYGLLDDIEGHKGEVRRFLSYTIYPKSGESNKKEDDKTDLVLIYFSDRILNKKAEDIRMKVHL